MPQLLFSKELTIKWCRKMWGKKYWSVMSSESLFKKKELPWKPEMGVTDFQRHAARVTDDGWTLVHLGVITHRPRFCLSVVAVSWAHDLHFHSGPLISLLITAHTCHIWVLHRFSDTDRIRKLYCKQSSWPKN